jgi:hypothetical protein
MPDNLKPLLYWVKERESIRKRREAGRPAPWTKDPILATYRFCNIKRQDDRVSRWLRTNVLTPGNLEEWGLERFLMFSAWCRWCNWPPTVDAVLSARVFHPINWKQVGQITDRIAQTEKAWTGAYMIRAPKKKGAKKGKYVAEVVVGKNLKAVLPELVRYFTEVPPTDRSYKAVHAILRRADGYGSFMAGQIAGDWTYTPLLNQAFDLKTWAPMGPGSVRGFNRIMQNPGKLSKRPPEALWLEKLVNWRAAIVKKLGPEYEDLTAMDTQNICCEVDKHLRVKNGEGRPRARYQPHTY